MYLFSLVTVEMGNSTEKNNVSELGWELLASQSPEVIKRNDLKNCSELQNENVDSLIQIEAGKFIIISRFRI